MTNNPFDDFDGENDYEYFEDFEEMDTLQSTIGFEIDDIERQAETDEAGALDSFLGRLAHKLRDFGSLWNKLGDAVNRAKGLLGFRAKEKTDEEEALESGLLISIEERDALLATGDWRDGKQIFPTFKQALKYITDAGTLMFSWVWSDGNGYGIIIAKNSGKGGSYTASKLVF